jgi:hypothetical protein
LNTGVIPSWLDWILRGSDGKGTVWYVFGCGSLVLAFIHFVHWRANHLKTDRSARFANFVSASAEVVLTLGGLFFFVIVVALVGSIFSHSLSENLPSWLAPIGASLNGKQSLSWFAACIAVLVGALGLTIYSRARLNRAVGEPPMTLRHAMWVVCEPPIFLGAIVLKAVVWFAILGVLLENAAIPSLSPWVQRNSGSLLATATVSSVLAVPLLHTYRRVSWDGKEPRPRFVEAGYTVFLALAAFGLTILVLTLGWAGIRALA